MEDLAIGTKINLASQGEQLERTESQFYSLNQDVDLTSRLSLAIASQRSRNKYVLWAVYALVLLCLLYILSSVFSWLAPLDSAEAVGDIKASGLPVPKSPATGSPSDSQLNNL